MREKPDYYDIGEIRLFPAEPYIKVSDKALELTPSPKHKSFLLALVRKYPLAVSYEELWIDVWRSKHKMTEDDRAKIQTTKGQLAAWLKSNHIESVLIVPRPGEGYGLDTEVVPGWFDEPKKPEQDKPQGEPEKTAMETVLPEIKEEIGEGFEKAKIEHWDELILADLSFLTAVAAGYGVLFLIATLLEIAYDFDLYGERAIFGGLISMAINISGIFAAAALMCRRLFRGKTGLWPAAVVLLAAAVFSIFIAYWFMPVHPVTEAEFQTQPALIAYGKNALLYFFPLGVMSILLPLYTVNAKRLFEEQIIDRMPLDFIFIRPGWLIAACLFLLIFSFAAINYLLDRLNPENRHYPLYAALIFLRMFVYFGLAAGSQAWYYAKVEKGAK